MQDGQPSMSLSWPAVCATLPELVDEKAVQHGAFPLRTTTDVLEL